MPYDLFDLNGNEEQAKPLAERMRAAVEAERDLLYIFSNSVWF